MKDKARMKSDEDVDLIAWGRKLWVKRKFIVYMTSIFVVLGVTYSLIIPVKYDASTIFITKSGHQERVPGSLGGLASLAGVSVNLGDSGSDIPSGLYSKLANSIPFLRRLAKTPLKMPDGTTTTYEQYYDGTHKKSGLEIISQYTLGLPELILKSKDTKSTEIKETSWLKLNQKEKQLFDRMANQLVINVNQKEGYIFLRFSMDKPSLSAQMATASFNLLQEDLIQYKIQKAQESFDFTEESFKQKRKEFFDIQDRLAQFKDRNKNIISASALNELERLQAEYDLKFRLYSELASQLEQGKLELNKERPVFFVIQPVSEPLLRTSPKRKAIVITVLLIGLFLAVALVLIKGTLVETWKKIRMPDNPNP